MEAAAPREVGGYTILGPLGQGGMGAVYRAVDADGRVVALKLLHSHLPDGDARERLQREVANLQRVRHRGVARVLDAEIESSDAFVVTELVDGLDLAEHIRLHGRLDPVALADFAGRLREALVVVHAAGVLHRDLTPGNVVLTADGPVLIDFGIAQAVEDARVTSAGLVAGTPGYVAPELLDGDEPSEESDWWGWSALVAFAATGRPPFGTGPARAVLSRTRVGEVNLPGLDPRTDAALRGALAVEPWHRTPPEDVVAELEVAAAGDTTTTPRTLLAIPDPGPDAGPDQGLGPGDVADTRVLEDWTPFDEEDARDAGDDGIDAGAPPRRVGTVLAAALALVVLGTTRPGVALVLAVAVAVVVRSIGLDAASVQRRRARRGQTPADVAGAVLAWPWYLVRALLGVVPAALVAATAVVLSGGVAWWLVGSERLVVAPPPPGEEAGELAGNAAWVTSAVLAAVVLIGLVAFWFGPMSRASRLGVRWVFAGPAGGSAAVVIALAALAVAAVLIWLVEPGPVVWWPMGGPPAVG